MFNSLFFFQDLVKLGNAAAESQFINLCFFLRQRFSIINEMLKKLQTDILKKKLDHWFNDSSKNERTAPHSRKS